MSQYGIGFTWTIANSAQQVEVLRYADSSGTLSTGTEESIAILEPGIDQYIDFLPNDNTLRHYRVRHTMPGYTAGAYSPSVRAKARPIPQYEEPQNFEA